MQTSNTFASVLALHRFSTAWTLGRLTSLESGEDWLPFNWPTPGGLFSSSLTLSSRLFPLFLLALYAFVLGLGTCISGLCDWILWPSLLLPRGDDSEDCVLWQGFIGIFSARESYISLFWN